MRRRRPRARPPFPPRGWRLGLGVVVLVLQGLRLGLVSRRLDWLTVLLLAVLIGAVLAAALGWQARRRGGRALTTATVVGGLVLSGLLGGRVLADHLAAHRYAIPGAPGYSTASGPHGGVFPVGHPWGRRCQPIRFTVEASVPDWVYAQVSAVVTEARRDGIDVALENRAFLWSPRTVWFPPGQGPSDMPRVPVFADQQRPRPRSDGYPPHLNIGWDAARDTPGHEHLTSLQGVLHLAVLQGDALGTRVAVRQLLAFTQGVYTSTRPSSGIADGSRLDRFDAADVAAMQRMSGCGTNPLVVVAVNNGLGPL